MLAETDGTSAKRHGSAYGRACRTPRKTHKMVAYRGYGLYREDCTYVQLFNAWQCTNSLWTDALHTRVFARLLFFFF